MQWLAAQKSVRYKYSGERKYSAAADEGCTYKRHTSEEVFNLWTCFHHALSSMRTTSASQKLLPAHMDVYLVSYTVPQA